MLYYIKKRCKFFAIIIAGILLCATLFLVIEKTHLMEHNHCNEEQCPICNIAYIVNKELKNVSLGNNHIRLALLVLLIFVASKHVNDYSYVKELSLVECKIRLND